MTHSLSELIAASSGTTIDDPGRRIERLRECFASLSRQHRFAPGQLVTWKPGLKNKRTPREGHPVVVVEVLDVPTRDPDLETGSAYFREPLDIITGEILDDQFLLYHMDSRRLMPFAPTED